MRVALMPRTCASACRYAASSKDATSSESMVARVRRFCKVEPGCSGGSGGSDGGLGGSGGGVEGGTGGNSGGGGGGEGSGCKMKPATNGHNGGPFEFDWDVVQLV
eukprot:7389288-Prymnesium_polylepis.2